MSNVERRISKVAEVGGCVPEKYGDLNIYGEVFSSNNPESS